MSYGGYTDSPYTIDVHTIVFGALTISGGAVRGKKNPKLKM